MRESLPEDAKSNRRGCILMAAAVVLFVLLAIAISSGWLGHRNVQKNPHIDPEASEHLQKH
jgi:hypothetical protein